MKLARALACLLPLRLAETIDMKLITPFARIIFTALFVAAPVLAAFAQAPLPPPQPPPPNASPAAPPWPTTAPAYPAAELDRIVSPIALYPDPLLAQVLAAATYADEIPEAARWADEHHNLAGASMT